MLKYSFLKKYIGAAVAVSLVLGMTFSAAAWNESPLNTTAEETTVAPADDDISTEDDIIIVEEDDEETVPTEEDDYETEDTDPPTTDVPEDTTTTTQAPVTEQTATPTYTEIAEKQVYALQTINIRKGPGTDFDILGVLAANEEITAKGTSGEWYAVTYYGGTGYILASLTSDTPPLTSQATTAPETETPVDEPEETTLPPVIAEPEETSPATTEPPVTTVEETKVTTSEETPAGTVDSNKNEGGGLKALLIALGSAVAAFLLIGVVPIVIHKIYHKNLYQY